MQPLTLVCLCKIARVVKNPIIVKVYINMGNGNIVKVEVIGKFRLLLKTRFIWILMIFIISSFQQN